MGESKGLNSADAGGCRRRWRAAGVLLFVVLPVVASCGFHLRGSQSAQPTAEKKLLPRLESVYVDGPIHSDIVVSLKEALELVGTRVASESGADVPVLAILKERFDKRLLAVGSDGKVVEQEFTLLVTFSFRDARAGTDPQPQTIRVIRDVLADERQFTAQLEEEATLRHEMVLDATRRILRRMRAVTA